MAQLMKGTGDRKETVECTQLMFKGATITLWMQRRQENASAVTSTQSVEFHGKENSLVNNLCKAWFISLIAKVVKKFPYK